MYPMEPPSKGPCEQNLQNFLIVAAGKRFIFAIGTYRLPYDKFDHVNVYAAKIGSCFP